MLAQCLVEKKVASRYPVGVGASLKHLNKYLKYLIKF